MADDETTTEEAQTEEGSEEQEKSEEKTEQPEGEKAKEPEATKEEPADWLTALTSPQGREMVSQAAEKAIAEREAERQAQDARKAFFEKPDEEVGRQVKEDMAKRDQVVELMPEVQRSFYEGVVGQLLKQVPELAELTPEERQAVLSPELRTDADVLAALFDVVGRKRGGNLSEEAMQKAIEEYEQKKAAEAVAAKDKETVPGLSGGTPVGATSGEVNPDKLLGAWFAENPAPED